MFSQVHWVRGDARLVGALARVPLRLSLCCVHEVQQHPLQKGGSTSPPGAKGARGSQTAQVSVLGSADVDLSQLVAPGPQGKQLPAKCVADQLAVVVL